MTYTPSSFYSAMESTEKDGLVISYDDETATISFEWDPDTHPQYDALKDLTSEEFCRILKDFITSEEHAQTQACQIQTGGQSGREAQSDGDSRLE